MSILRNFSVICGHRQIGLLQNASLDEAQKQVLALIVSCGIRGKRVILPESIEAIGRGFIIARDVRLTIARRKRRSAPSSGTPPGCFAAV